MKGHHSEEAWVAGTNFYWGNTGFSQDVRQWGGEGAFPAAPTIWDRYGAVPPVIKKPAWDVEIMPNSTEKAEAYFVNENGWSILIEEVQFLLAIGDQNSISGGTAVVVANDLLEIGVSVKDPTGSNTTNADNAAQVGAVQGTEFTQAVSPATGFVLGAGEGINLAVQCQTANGNLLPFAVLGAKIIYK